MKKKYLIFKILLVAICNTAYGQEIVVGPPNFSFWSGQLSDSYSASTTVYSYVNGHIYKANNDLWEQVSDNFHNGIFDTKQLASFFVDSNNTLWVYKEFSNFISYSLDEGKSWQFKNIPTLGAGEMLSSGTVAMSNKKLYFSIDYFDTNPAIVGLRNKLFTLDYLNNNSIWFSFPKNDSDGYADLTIKEDALYKSYEFKSLDHGVTWIPGTKSSALTGLADFYEIGIDKVFFAVLDRNLYFTSNNGVTLTKSTGLPGIKIKSIKILSQNLIICDLNFAGNEPAVSNGGYYISTDGGFSFSKLNDGQNFWSNFYLKNVSKDANYLYLNANKYRGFRRIALDNSTSTDFNNNVDNTYPHDVIKLDYDLNGTLYAFLGGDEGIDGIISSTNNGVTWQRDADLWVRYWRDLRTITVAGQGVVYAAGYDPGVVNKSLNNGVNWLNTGQHSAFTIEELFSDKLNPDRVFYTSITPDGGGGASSIGTFASFDGAKSFGSSQTSIDPELTKDVLFVDANTIYMLFENRIMKTIDNGKTWVKISSKQLDKIIINDVSGKMYGFYDKEIYESTDSGSTWNLFSPILGIPVIIDLFYANYKNNQSIIASTENGVFSFPLSNNPASKKTVNSSWSQKTATVYDNMIWNPIVGSLFATNGFGLTKIGPRELVLDTPTGDISQQLCSGSTVSNLAAITSGSATLKWYDSAVGGKLLDATTPLLNGNHYFASQATSYTESQMRFEVSATVQNTASPAITYSIRTFCGETVLAQLANSVIGNDVKWYDNIFGGEPLWLGTRLINGKNYYSTQTINSCESISRSAIQVVLHETPPPTGPSRQLFSASKTVSDLVAYGLPYKINSNPLIRWYVSASGGNYLSKTTPLVNNTYYYASQTVLVDNTFDCRSITRLVVFVTSDIITTPLVSIVGKNIGTISWETDQDLITTDGVNYYLYNFYLPSGDFKFRQDHAWLINWGGTSASGTFPTGIGVQDGINIMGIGGTYNFTFNRQTGAYQFEKKLGIIENEINNLKIYPNPTSNIVTISYPYEKIKQINVYNMLGSLLKSQKGNSGKEQINIQDLPNATYLVEIKTDKEIQTIKIIKE